MTFAPSAERGFLDSHVSLHLASIQQTWQTFHFFNSCWWDCICSCFPSPELHLHTVSKS